jgi:dTDP-4-amino-4,6-dideoxygalactose transaminase
MTELCGAVLLGQLEKLDSVVEDYISKAQSYQDVLKECKWLVPQYVPDGYRHVYWVCPYLFEGEEYGIKLEDFQRVAKEEQAGMGFGYTKAPANMIGLFTEPRAYGKGCPTRCPLYAGEVHYGPGVCPVAEDILPRIVLLWCEPEDLARVLKKIEGAPK